MPSSNAWRDWARSDPDRMAAVNGDLQPGTLAKRLHDLDRLDREDRATRGRVLPAYEPPAEVKAAALKTGKAILWSIVAAWFAALVVVGLGIVFIGDWP